MSVQTVTNKAKKRVRLETSSRGKAGKRRERPSGAATAGNSSKAAPPSGKAKTPASGGENAATASPSQVVTPEALAYALPGGLARLYYRNWRYTGWIKYMEDKLLPLGDGGHFEGMISCPPRSGKTMFISRTFPAWFLGRNPDKRVLLVCYQENFARTQSRYARNIFAKHGKSVFGLSVATDSKAANQWDIEGHQGGMEAVGAEGAITGKGADLLILDDLIKGREVAMNMRALDKIWDWLDSDVFSRLEPDASIIMMMTRWSMFDPIGRVLQKQEELQELLLAGEDIHEDDRAFEEWRYYNFPALATENDLLGRKPGEALFPERFDESDLRRRKARSTEYWWESLYQGNPIPLKGEIIDVNWFRSYQEAFARNEYDMIVISIDTANSDTEIADYSVFMVFGVKDSTYHILDVVRDKMQWPKLLATAKELDRVWHPEQILIEDKGSGTSLIQQLRSEEFYNIVPMTPDNTGKVLRMQSETAVLRAGAVLVPKEASWRDDFMLEMRSFPRGSKDQVDSLSQFLKYMRQNSSGIRMW